MHFLSKDFLRQSDGTDGENSQTYHLILSNCVCFKKSIFVCFCPETLIPILRQASLWPAKSRYYRIITKNT